MMERRPTMESKTLLPCPWCGSERVVVEDKGIFSEDAQVTCRCGVRGPYVIGSKIAKRMPETRAKAAAKWNSRSVPAVPVEELRKVIEDSHDCTDFFEFIERLDGLLKKAEGGE